MKPPLLLLFVCVENSCRSQMAEGFARAAAGDRVEVWSAGSRPSGRVDVRAIAFMGEKGVDLSSHASKGLDDLPGDVTWDFVVTMGCGDACPHLPARRRIDRDLPDPKELDDEGFRGVRDAIAVQVKTLIDEAGVAGCRGVPLPTGLAFRPLDASDSLAELTELLHRAYVSLAAAGFAYVASHQSEETTRARAGSGECWVGVLDGRLVATATLVAPGAARGAPWYERARVSRLQQLAVDPSLQGRGVGSALMDLLEARAREIGAEEIAIDTAEGAERLIRMYESRGYRLVGHVDWRPRTNYRSVIMSLSL